MDGIRLTWESLVIEAVGLSSAQSTSTYGDCHAAREAVSLRNRPSRWQIGRCNDRLRRRWSSGGGAEDIGITQFQLQ